MRPTLIAIALSLFTINANASLGSEVDGFAARLMREGGGPPGLAIAVVQNGRVVLERGYGFADIQKRTPVTPQTRFYIASSTKPFTAAAARLLAEEGKLDLDAPLTKTLPRLEFPSPLSTERVSLRDFLTHRAGITSGAVNFRVSNAGTMTDDDIYASFKLQTDSVPVGFRYSNVSYILAGLALEQAAGSTWQEVLRSRLFEPLGMKNTSTSPGNEATAYAIDADGPRPTAGKKESTMHPAGGMVSTAADLGRFLIAQIDDGRIDGRQVLPKRAISELHTPQVHLSANWGPLKRYAYGLGWYLADYDGDRLVHHFGGFGGSYAHISFMPEHDIGVVVLSNGGRDPAETLAWFTYDTLLEKKGLGAKYDLALGKMTADLAKSRAERSDRRREIEQRLASPSPTHALSTYVGRYRSNRLGDVVVRADGSRLIATMGVLATTLVPEEENGFGMDWSGGTDLEPVKFEFDANGQATVFDWDGRRFERVE